MLRSLRKIALGFTVVLVVSTPRFANAQTPKTPILGIGDPFAGFDLPDEWEVRFWAGANAQGLLKLDPKAVSDLVPPQAGFRYCRCPFCDAREEDDPLAWSIDSPKSLTCKVCSAVAGEAKKPAADDPKPADDKAAPPVPEIKPAEDKPPAPPPGERRHGEKKPEEGKPAPAAEKKPADDKAAAPAAEKKPATEETIEVLPKIVHHYPYVELPDLKQHYPGERLYLEAKADYEAREFLSKAALYAAVRHHGQAAADKDPTLADLAALIVIRFAQVYPAYATHFDQPNAPKFLQQADLAPPYRQGYKTAKWDWNGSLNVPLNLVIAYALIRDDPAIEKASAFLKVENARQLIERDLFRSAAEFTRSQPEEINENALQATRGILAVGRLLDDPMLVSDAMARLDRFSQKGFYHDGFWGKGTRESHQRVISQLDGWIERLLLGFRSTEPLASRRIAGNPPEKAGEIPLLTLARSAGSALLNESTRSDVEVVSWPARPLASASRLPRLLGGTGIARLAVGEGAQGLDVELRGLDSFGPEQIQRQDLRLGAKGRILLGDLDESKGLSNGFDRSSVSHNTVIVDGLNQRESILQARNSAPGANFLFFAADPDFQATTQDDPHSYPRSTKRYRQTLIASSGPRNRYAVSIFEVHGGLQHEQYFHGPADSSARWKLALPLTLGPPTLLPPSITHVPNSQPDDDRWFVQSQGEFSDLEEATSNRPTTATLLTQPEANTGIRLHLLTSGSSNLITGASPGALTKGGRGSLVIHRRSSDGATLNTTFVTVFEPFSPEVPRLKRVGRVESSATTVVIYLETVDGPEQIVVNLAPGKPCKVTLADGREFSTDGLASRIRDGSIVLAGGTFAEAKGIRLNQAAANGTIAAAVRKRSEGSCGHFETDEPIANPERLAGRTLLITHGDGTTRGWTIRAVQNVEDGARIFVREEPGFLIDLKSKEAGYYQFPQSSFKGPHTFRVSLISRGGGE